MSYPSLLSDSWRYIPIKEWPFFSLFVCWEIKWDVGKNGVAKYLERKDASSVVWVA